MTNFEKWKNSLTLDDFINEDKKFFCGIINCGTCPTRKNCKETRHCKKQFTKWALKEAKR